MFDTYSDPVSPVVVPLETQNFQQRYQQQQQQQQQHALRNSPPFSPHTQHTHLHSPIINRPSEPMAFMTHQQSQHTPMQNLMFSQIQSHIPLPSPQTHAHHMTQYSMLQSEAPRVIPFVNPVNFSTGTPTAIPVPFSQINIPPQQQQQQQQQRQQLQSPLITDVDIHVSDKQLIQSLIAENNQLKQQLDILRSISTNIQDQILTYSPTVSDSKRRRTLDLLVHNNMTSSFDSTSNDVGIILSVSSGQIVAVCPRLRRMLGYDVVPHEPQGYTKGIDLKSVDPDDILLKTWKDLLHPTSFEESWKLYENAVPNRETTVKMYDPLLKRKSTDGSQEASYVKCKLMENHIFYYQPALPSEDSTILYVLSRITL
jgi:hypothetical protein